MVVNSRKEYKIICFNKASYQNFHSIFDVCYILFSSHKVRNWQNE